MEREKEELSQELISAKLQVAQLYMEVDGLKLQHRQATIAAEAAHALQMEMNQTARQTLPNSSHPRCSERLKLCCG